MNTVAECALQARSDALDGAEVEAILDGIVTGLDETLQPFTFIAVLRLAFDIPVRTLRDVENWDRLHPKGDMTTSELTSLLRPWIAGLTGNS